MLDQLHHVSPVRAAVDLETEELGAKALVAHRGQTKRRFACQVRPCPVRTGEPILPFA